MVKGEGGTVGTDGTNMTTLVFEPLSKGHKLPGLPAPHNTDNTEWRCAQCQGCFLMHATEGTPKRCPHCFCSACADCSAPTVDYFAPVEVIRPMLDDPHVGPNISAMIALCDPCVTTRRANGAELPRFIWEPPA